MPLEHGTSNKVRQRNIKEMIAAGHPPVQSVAAAYREQRQDRAKASHRSRKMPESAAHAPGHEISGEGGSVRQRHRMGEGGSPMGGNFGIDNFHTANKAGGQSHGAHVAHDGMVLADHERAGPPALHQGAHMMHATAHSHHGPHHHSHAMHHHAPEGTRPHHVGHHRGHK